MHHAFLDRYSRLASAIHRIPASIKLVAALAVCLLTISSPGRVTAVHLALTLFLLVGVIVSTVPIGFLVRRLLFLEPLVLGIALFQLLLPGGWTRFLVILLKSTLCLLTMILLSNTTPFAEILRVLRKARIPAILVTLLALMYRYVFLLMDEAERMRRAQQSRSFRSGRRRTWQGLATVAGRLFVRSTERSERIYSAMCARGWR
jgi:cobalt/nickel transport system permease protein